MQVASLEELLAGGAPAGAAVTVGAYDGVHLGHRRLLGVLRAEAEVRDVPAAVVTFDRHPATVVRPASAPRLLTDADQKLELLAGCGVDLTVVVPFDEARAKERAADFAEEVLVRALRAKVVVVGEDFHFGHGREGDVALLGEMGGRHGFSVVPVAIGDGSPGGVAVSSTRIRKLLEAGDVAGAAALLDRPHEVRGTVVRGDGRGGAELGIPTANMAVPEDIALPAVGVYAGVARRADGTCHAAAVSVGLRPTFYDPAATGADGPSVRPLLEAHLVDLHADLYGERLAVQFLERLRDERRFESVDDLARQMHRDIAAARSIGSARTC